MRHPERIDLGAVDEPGERIARCPGALFVVDRVGYRDLQKNGVKLATDLDDLPTAGKAYVRVHCDANEEVVYRGGTAYRTGRCVGCATMEKAQRALLRAQKGER